MQKLCEIVKLLHSILQSLKSIGDWNSMRRVLLFHNNNDDNNNNNNNNNNKNDNDNNNTAIIIVISVGEKLGN